MHRTLNVSDIQHFSTGDGSGIRTTVFLKGCNLHCPWCHNPETISPLPETLVYPTTNQAVSYGRYMTVEEILSDVMEDAPFYAESGGGVTISGGEPLLQAGGVAALAKALASKGVSVLLDTAGCVPWSAFETVLPYVDTVFFDWKSPSHTIYSNLIGGDLELIAENLSRLLKTGASVHVRIPLIPGIHTETKSCKKTCAVLSSLGVTHVDLLPFHRLGSGKYIAMEKNYVYARTQPLTDQAVEAIRKIFASYFTVTVER